VQPFQSGARVDIGLDMMEQRRMARRALRRNGCAEVRLLDSARNWLQVSAYSRVFLGPDKRGDPMTDELSSVSDDDLATAEGASLDEQASGGDWLDAIDPESAAFARTKGWEDLDAVIRSYQNLESLLGSDRAGRTIVLPSSEGDTEALREKWGRRYESRVASAQRAARRFGGDEAATLEQAIGYGPMTEFLARIGDALGEDALPAGEGRTGFGLSPDEARYSYAQRKRDPEFVAALQDAAHPGHAAATTERARYLAAIWPAQ
jgi:hypothetical protein